MIIRTKNADGKTLIDIRREKRKRKKTRKKILLGIMLLLMIFIGLLFTPIFNLSEIEVTGNKKVETKDILSSSGFVLGENIFKFKLKRAGESVAKIPYINTVEIQRRLPKKVEIKVTECIPLAYVKSADEMIIIDKEGKALEKKTNQNNYDLPILFDFEFKSYTLGKKISENNNEKLEKTLEITKNLYNNNLIEDVSSITTQKGDIYLNFKSGLKVIVGDEKNIESKITMLKEVLKVMPDNKTGIIDARNPDKLYHRYE